MEYKILQIDSGALKKVSDAVAHPNTIMAAPTDNPNWKAHTEEYYLIISVLVEYAGERGTVVDDTTFKVMTATYDKDNLCTSVSTEDLPTEQEIMDAAMTAAEKWASHVDHRDMIRTVVESTRNKIDTYNYNVLVEDPQYGDTYKDIWDPRYLKQGLGI